MNYLILILLKLLNGLPPSIFWNYPLSTLWISRQESEEFEAGQSTGTEPGQTVDVHGSAKISNFQLQQGRNKSYKYLHK